MSEQVAKAIIEVPYPVLLAIVLALVCGGIGLVTWGVLRIVRGPTPPIPYKASEDSPTPHQDRELRLAREAMQREQAFQARGHMGDGNAMEPAAQEKLPDMVIDCAGPGMDDDDEGK